MSSVFPGEIALRCTFPLENGMFMPGKLCAEAIGTFWLVLGGCGSAAPAAVDPERERGFLGVAPARPIA